MFFALKATVARAMFDDACGDSGSDPGQGSEFIQRGGVDVDRRRRGKCDALILRSVRSVCRRLLPSSTWQSGAGGDKNATTYRERELQGFEPHCALRLK
jgi:hypothetical protein